MEILSVRNIVKTFDKVRAVDGVSFSVHRGTITGLLGRNGAGKTTTIRMITGIFYPDSGSIDWAGDGVTDFRDRVGYLPEERGLYKQMNVIELLLFLAEIKGVRGGEVKKRIDRWMERFELTDKKQAKVEELSKGNQQKVQLIGTLLHEPELIILDEPQSGLDPVNMVLVRELLIDLRNEGKTILLSTHMMAEAEMMADHIILIDRGRVVLDGRLDEVRRAEGNNTVKIEFDGNGEFLRSLRGVEAANVKSNAAELDLAAGEDPQSVLEAAIGKLRVRHFSVGAPSLEQIFIKRVGTETLPEVA